MPKNKYSVDRDEKRYPGPDGTKLNLAEYKKHSKKLEKKHEVFSAMRDKGKTKEEKISANKEYVRSEKKEAKSYKREKIKRLRGRGVEILKSKGPDKIKRVVKVIKEKQSARKKYRTSVKEAKKFRKENTRKYINKKRKGGSISYGSGSVKSYSKKYPGMGG